MTLLLALLGCTEPKPIVPTTYVRTGVIQSPGKGRALPNGGAYRPVEWTPGVGPDGTERPVVAECVPLASVGLGDLDTLVARGISAPDTALAFSPDGATLAIGTYLGEILVVDGWNGEVRARRTVAESAIKRVAWSRDGAELYAAEQSPDAIVRALDPATLADRATFRLADALETSAPPGPDDVFGLYTLPGAYGLEVRPDGTLVVVGAHGWNTADGRRNRSQVWRLAREADRFEVRATWPEQPADATFLALATDPERVAVSVSRSSPGDADPTLPVGGIAVLDAETLTLEDRHVPPPLTPWFDRAFVWESIGLGPNRLTLGLGDGRVWRPDQSRDLGIPIMAGDVPIAATIGHLTDDGEAVYVLTSGTSIPYSASRADLQPPEPHPQEDTLFALDPGSLETLWTWRGEEAVHGLTRSGRWLVVGAGQKRGDDSTDRYGVLVFDTQREGRGARRLAAFCGTGQPVFFRTAIAPDGRIAVVSFPEKQGETVRGEYRVTLFL